MHYHNKGSVKANKWQVCILIGDERMCSVTIASVETHDHGDWTCAISDTKSLDTVKQVVEVGVVVAGDVTLSATGGVSGGAQLQCSVTNTWPPPSLSWTVSSEQGTMDTSRREIIHKTPDSHLVSVSKAVNFIPDQVANTDVNITCNVVQTYNDIITTRKKTIQLQMLQNGINPATYHMWLSETVAGVTFIIVSIICILIIIFLLLVIIVRRFQRRCLPCVTPVYTCTLETVPTIDSNITTSQPRSGRIINKKYEI